MSNVCHSFLAEFCGRGDAGGNGINLDVVFGICVTHESVFDCKPSYSHHTRGAAHTSKAQNEMCAGRGKGVKGTQWLRAGRGKDVKGTLWLRAGRGKGAR